MQYQTEGQMQVPGPASEGVGAFIRRTYTVLSISLAVIVGLGFLSYYFLPTTAFLPLALANFIIWIPCGMFGWRRPIALSLGLFSVITGLFLGQLGHLHAYAGVMGQAALLTLVTFVGLSAYVHITKADFSYLRGFLCMSFFILLGAGLVMAIFGTHGMDLLYSIFGVVVFSCWILYDTSQILNRMDDDMTPEIAAFELLLDLVALFRFILSILRRR